MEKSADAFRTISEVAEDLALPQHVLRFWETRFPQIRPLKRAGGRRYYRPSDVILLRSIRQLLYDEGYTIKGVQRLLKEQGARGLRAGEPSVALPIDEPKASAEAMLERWDLPEAPDGIPPNVPRDLAGGHEPGLRDVLVCIEECEQILLTVRQPQ